MNAVDETAQGASEADQCAQCNRVAPYIFGKSALGSLSAPRSRYNKEVMLMGASQAIGRDVDAYFDRYMRELKFSEMTPHIGLAVKKEHTVVEKWPPRLKLSLPQTGAHKEFDILQASDHSGSERHVEWKRV